MHQAMRAICVTALALSLANCGGDDKTRNLSTLDSQLTNNTDDPAFRAAIEGPIATDPDLREDANRDAVRPADKPLTGAVPAKLSLKEAKAQALKLAGGKLMRTPATTRNVTSTKEPVTLGGLAEQKQRSRKCGTRPIEYAMRWAARMPEDFPIYPGGNVSEAAGADNPPCNIRAVSFTTPVAPDAVMDFYTTMAKRAGYTVEHIEENGGNVLGGTRDRDEGAYYLSFKPAANGGTAVDMIANLGR